MRVRSCPNHALPERTAEMRVVEHRQLLTVDRMILAAPRGDLDRPEQRRKPAGPQPVPPVRDAVKKAAPKDLPTPGKFRQASETASAPAQEGGA